MFGTKMTAKGKPKLHRLSQPKRDMFDLAAQIEQTGLADIPNELFVESRLSPRHRVLKKISIDVRERGRTYPAMLRSISDIGATINLEDTYYLPMKFTIMTTDGGLHENCQVVWRNQTTLGVKFV